MKLKVISRSTDDFTHECSKELQKVFRNYDPTLRSQEKVVEYTRAPNATELEETFVRPFVRAMDGHIDVISCTAKNPNHLRGIFSGTRDGDIRLWDIVTRKTICQFPGHQGSVQGLTASTDGDILVSCGIDCTVRLCNVPNCKTNNYEDSDNNASKPLAVYEWKLAFWGVDHKWNDNFLW